MKPWQGSIVQKLKYDFKLEERMKSDYTQHTATAFKHEGDLLWCIPLIHPLAVEELIIQLVEES